MREALRTTLVPRLPAPCRVATQGLPASARLSGSALSWSAALRALRFAQARASAAASPRWPCAKPPPLLGSSHGSLRAWLPFGPARETSAIPPRARSACDGCLRSPARESGAPRAVAASRLAALARAASGSGFAFASLSPPREALPLQFPFPSRAASSQVCRHPATPAALPCPRSPPRASGVEWLAMLAGRDEQGRSPARPRAPQPREEQAARFACPLARLAGAACWR